MSLKFLVIRFSAIGDSVMTVPVAASVRRAMPDADIWWAIEARCQEVVERGRLVNRVQAMDRERWKRGRWSPGVWREQMTIFGRLRRERFDYGIDIQGHSKTAICLRLAAPKRRISAHATDALARALNPVADGDSASMHTVDWNLRTLSKLGDFSTEARWIMPPLTAERAHIREEGKPLATIAVASGHVSKNYPAEGWACVAESLLQKGFRVAFLGGPTDCAPRVCGGLDWVGKLNLAETMAAVAESDVHLAADTGTGHMAAAYGVPVASLFGPSNPEHWAPYTSKRVVLRAASRVTADIDPADVLGAVESLRRQS